MGRCKRGYQRDKVNKTHLSVQTLFWEFLPSCVAPALAPVRPYTAHNPSIQLVEELTDVGFAKIVPPAAYDGIDLCNQLLCLQGSLSPRELA